MTIEQLRAKPNEIASKMRALVKKAEDEDRGFTAEEQAEWRNMNDEFEALEARVQAADRLAKLELPGNDPEPRGGDLPGRGDTDPGAAGAAGDGDDAAEEYRNAFMSWVRYGRNQLTPSEREALFEQRMSNEEIKELRQQGVGTDAAGGFLVPEGFAGFITERRLAFGALRAAAGSVGGPTLIETGTGNDLPFPDNDDTGNAGAIIAESVADTDQDMVFGEVRLGAFTYTSRIVRVSVELMQDEEVQLEPFIGRKLGERLGRATAPHYANGTGAAQPQGLVSGVATVAAAAAGAIAYADLINLKHGVDPAYRVGAPRFVFNDTTFRDIKLLLDGNGRPLWQPAVGSEVPGTMDGDSYIIEQGVPNVGTGLRSAVYGDLSGFVIREVLGVTLMRLAERCVQRHNLPRHQAAARR